MNFLGDERFYGSICFRITHEILKENIYKDLFFSWYCDNPGGCGSLGEQLLPHSCNYLLCDTRTRVCDRQHMINN